MSSNSRHFTLDEARSVLGTLLPDLSRMVELKKILNAKNYDVYRHAYFGGGGPNGTKHYPPELEELVEIAQHFAEAGVAVKSLDQGLIDFPHIRKNGEEVYLCYKLGEDDILFWHPIKTGFAGRKSTTQL
ncbi:MAG TPA: DUF2203 domain-containing protein [Candidatus Kryptonia bacterium]